MKDEVPGNLPSYSPDRGQFRLRGKRARSLTKIRPTILALPFLKLLSHRQIVEVEGLKLYLDPTTHLGQSIINHGTYEAETIRLFRQHVKEGDVVLDIGANEGFFSALAKELAGPTGRVIAIEPQGRLQDILEINLALNGGAQARVVKAVIGEEDQGTVDINLYPSSNTGATSVVRRYRFRAKTEAVRTRTPASLLAEFDCCAFDFVKIDVEGYEPEVVRSLAPLLEQKQVGKLLLDYHESILRMRGIDPVITHELVLKSGMRATEGMIGSGYVLYARD